MVEAIHAKVRMANPRAWGKSFFLYSSPLPQTWQQVGIADVSFGGFQGQQVLAARTVPHRRGSIIGLAWIATLWTGKIDFHGSSPSEGDTFLTEQQTGQLAEKDKDNDHVEDAGG